MARGRKPIFTEIDQAAMTILDSKDKTDALEKETLLPFGDPLDIISEYRPAVYLNLSLERYPYSRLWQEYDLTISGKQFQLQSGFDQSNYTKAKRGKKPIRESQLAAACLLCDVTIQQAYDVFHMCRDTEALSSLGFEGSVLCFLLHDFHDNGIRHNYNELIWYTIRLHERAGETELPELHKNQWQWKRMKHLIDEEDISLQKVKNIGF